MRANTFLTIEETFHVKALMKSHGLKRAATAKKLRCTETWISLVVNGYSKGPRIRKGIAKLLGMPVHEVWQIRKRAA